MRRALTTGLALYLGLGGVLSSPVQVQAPFELNKDNTPEVEGIPAASELKFFFPLILSIAFHRGGLFVGCATEIERTGANPHCCNPEPPRQLRGRFLHITDMHPDPLYRAGTTVSTACHRNRPKKEKPRAGYLGTPYEFVIFSFLSFSLSLPKALAEIFWICKGRAVAECLILIFPCYREKCDSPLELTNYTLDHLEKHWTDHIDFVICASRLVIYAINLHSDLPLCSSRAMARCLTLLVLVGGIRDR